jgi:uncharacterized membrane protein YkoI
MKRFKALHAVIMLLGIGCTAIPASARDEETVSLDQVPNAVKATILREAKGGTITEIERETKDGKTVYEAEFLLDGAEIEIEIAPDGKLLGREVEQENDEDDLTIGQVPEPARAALLKLAGPAEITEAEQEKEDGVLVYEAEWVLKGTKHEAAVTADGTLIEIEETIPPEAAPPVVRAAIAKHFGSSAKVVVEKKMIVVYEVEARVDGKEKELLVFPTGRVHEEDDNDDDDDDND